MKKEQEILLAPEDIQQLLEGGLYWKDISSKLSTENPDSFKQNIETDEEVNIEEVSRSLAAARENEEEKNIRSILFGEDKKQTELQSKESVFETDSAIQTELPEKEENVTINRQIDLSRMEAEAELEELKERPPLVEPEVDNEFKSILSEQPEEEQELEEEQGNTVFGGLKLIIMLVVVAVLTFAFWYYFLDL